MNKRLFLLAFVGTVTTTALADDYGTWFDAAVQKGITKAFSVDVGLGLRAENKLKDVTRYDVDAGLTYKPVKGLSFSAGYNFIRDYNLSSVTYKSNADGKPRPNVDDAYWRNKHRATFDVSGAIKLIRIGKKKLQFNVRERYQYTHFVPTHTTQTNYRGYVSNVPEGYRGNIYYYDDNAFTRIEQKTDNKSSKHKHYLRSRFGLEYDINSLNLAPYVTYEFSNNLSDGMHLDKQRLTVGMEWKVTKQHKLDFAYVYNHGSDDDDSCNSHILSVGYKFKF